MAKREKYLGLLRRLSELLDSSDKIEVNVTSIKDFLVHRQRATVNSELAIAEKAHLKGTVKGGKATSRDAGTHNQYAHPRCSRCLC